MTTTIRAAGLAAAIALLAACGGGDGDSDTVLPLAANAPQAYTDAYLAAHPGALIQPEHLLIVNLDPQGPRGGIVRVRVKVARPLTLRMGPPAGGPPAKVLAELTIHDAAGTKKLHYRDGEGPASVVLEPGEHALTFHPKRGATAARSLFVKLADTPAQVSGRRDRISAMATAVDVGQRLEAVGFGENCPGCDFSNADLTRANFYESALQGSTFYNAIMDGIDFRQANCSQCQITASPNMPDMVLSNSNFERAVLAMSVIDRPDVYQNSFKGADLRHARLAGRFFQCDFGPSLAPYLNTALPTNLGYTDLRSARFDGNDNFAAALFTDAQAAPTTFTLNLGATQAVRTAFAGAVLDGMTPGTLFVDGKQQFAGYDLSGTSFKGIDLSTQDLSVGAGVTISTSTDFSQSILSDGTRGVSLAGQSFPTGFAVFAGTEADPNSGRDLRGTNFSNAGLFQADLTRARLDGAVLVGANLSYANLSHASLKGAQLGVAPGTGTQSIARLDNAFMPGVDLSDADLRSASLAGAHAYGQGVSFQRTRLDGASLSGAFLMQASFVSASLNDANLTGAALISATFDGATLSNAKLSASYLQGADFSTVAAVMGLDISNAVVSPGGGIWQFTEVDKTPYSFAYDGTALGLLGVSTQVVCPNGDLGPCTASKLVPTKVPPYPVQPACVPLRKYSYKNCEADWVPPAS